MTDQHSDFTSANLDAWHLAAAKSAPGGQVDALNWVTPDGIVVKPLYTAADTADLPHADTLPGFAPYVRGTSKKFVWCHAEHKSTPQQPETSLYTRGWNKRTAEHAR